jgi:hypothetical protein
MDMKTYHKIQSVFKRDMDAKGHPFIDGAWTLPEFEYLAGNEWVWTDKVDGTNVRVGWDGETVDIRGRTDKAQFHPSLDSYLRETFTPHPMRTVFPANEDGTAGEVTLYGEGYGCKIQKGGGYLRDRVAFILFDVNIGGWWLRREDVEDVADRLGIDAVPIVGRGTLHEAIEMIRGPVPLSPVGDGNAPSEGIVCRPAVELHARNHQRIITKIKYRDFR